MRICGVCEAEVRPEDYDAHMARHGAEGWVDIPRPDRKPTGRKVGPGRLLDDSFLV